jgi:TfoX/Sxy family transcriptional regulator of competence genes
MTTNEKLANRVREALAKVPNVEEKRMFGGIGFMVNGKFCVSVRDDRIMCRVDPAEVPRLTKLKGATIMEMKGRKFAGYVRVDEKVLKTRKDIDFWVSQSLDFNPRAKSSKT